MDFLGLGIHNNTRNQCHKILKHILKYLWQKHTYGCNRNIRVGSKSFNIDIPKGVTTGKTIVYAGQGGKGIWPT